MSPFFPSSSLPCKRSPIGGSLSTSCLSVLSVSTGLSFCLSHSAPPPPSCCRSRPQGLVVAGSPFDAQGCLLPASLPGIQEGHSGRPLADDAPGLSAGVSAAAASLSSPCSLPCPRRGLGGGCSVRGGVPRHEALQGHRKAGGEPCDLRAGCAGRVQARPWHFGALAPNPQSAQIHCK